MTTKRKSPKLEATLYVEVAPAILGPSCSAASVRIIPHAYICTFCLFNVAKMTLKPDATRASRGHRRTKDGRSLQSDNSAIICRTEQHYGLTTCKFSTFSIKRSCCCRLNGISFSENSPHHLTTMHTRLSTELTTTGEPRCLTRVLGKFRFHGIFTPAFAHGFRDGKSRAR